MDGVCAPQENFDGGVVQSRFSFNLSRLGEHQKKMK